LPANRIADPRQLALGGSQEIKPACIRGSSDHFDFLLVIRRSGTTTPLGHDPNTTVLLAAIICTRFFSFATLQLLVNLVFEIALIIDTKIYEGRHSITSGGKS
jgi:hypothetical protein